MALAIYPLPIVRHPLIPVILLIALWRNATRTKFHWLLAFLLAATFSSVFFLAGVGWSWLSYYFRIFLPAAFLIVSYVSYRRARHLPVFPKPSSIRWLAVTAKIAIISYFSYGLAVIIPGLFPEGQPVELSFPLRNGFYYVGHGGSNVNLNRHYLNQAQKYALDIGKLNVLGTRAMGIYPKDLTRYTIFGDTLHSPCEGSVTQAVDGLPDLIPPDSDPKHPAGNHVLIACRGVKVLLAHMMSGSLVISAGDLVQEGQVLGRVGNSGNTSEPHLHIHAAEGGSGEGAVDGEGVPMLFEGRFLVRNSLVIRRD
jgi:hypothetical protein